MVAGAGLSVRPANGFRRRSVGGKRGREAIPCQDRSRRRRWPKASLYKGLPPDQTRPPRTAFAGISPRPRSGDNAPGMQAWRGNDRQETVNFKPLIFSEIHAAGDNFGQMARRDAVGDRWSIRFCTGCDGCQTCGCLRSCRRAQGWPGSIAGFTSARPSL